MQIVLVCPDRMGNNIRRLLRKNGHDCIIFNDDSIGVDQQTNEQSFSASATLSSSVKTDFSLNELMQSLHTPRIVWVMAPTSAKFAQTIDVLIEMLEPGDIVIDSKSAYCQGGGCAERLEQRGIHYVDVGTSTCRWSVKRGYYLMIGGEPNVVSYLEPIFAALTPPAAKKYSTLKSNKANLKRKRRKIKPAIGHFYCGAAGAGHFARQFYDGVEETLMRAYAEILAERDSLKI